MKIVKPNCEIIEQAPGMIGALKHIEKVGRTCYRSEDKITEDSHIRFVNMLIENRHYAMLEHATIYLTIPIEREDLIDIYKSNPYSRVVVPRNSQHAYVTTNSRVITENGWQCDMNYLVPAPTKHAKRITVKFSTSIGVSREFNRHRVNSMAEQSTRYCNYSKDKFDNEISLSLPSWVEETDTEIQASFSDYCMSLTQQQNKDWDTIDYWLFANLACEHSYLNLIRLGWTPEKARSILPLDTHTELIHTAFVEDWKHFLDLRYYGKTGKPHPDAYKVAEMLYKQLKELKYIK